MEIDRFDRSTIDKYLVMAKKQYPEVDIHLLEYAISDYLIYDVEKMNDQQKIMTILLELIKL